MSFRKSEVGSSLSRMRSEGFSFLLLWDFGGLGVEKCLLEWLNFVAVRKS